MELSRYEKLSLIRIKRWEKEKHEGIGKKMLDGVSGPVDYLIKKIGREKFNLFEKAIEATVDKMLHASTYSVNSKDLIKRAREHGILIEDLSELKTVNFKLLDDCNRKHITFHERAGAAQGAVAGIAGVLAAPADLTAVLIQIFHLIQEIAFCYGFNPNSLVEKQILLRIMEASIGSSEKKFNALKEIEKLKGIETTGDADRKQGDSVSIVGSNAIQEQIQSLSIGLLIRMIPRALPIPIITMAIGAHSDHEMMEKAGEAAFMVYRKRFIERKAALP